MFCLRVTKATSQTCPWGWWSYRGQDQIGFYFMLLKGLWFKVPYIASPGGPSFLILEILWRLKLNAWKWLLVCCCKRTVLAKGSHRLQTPWRLPSAPSATTERAPARPVMVAAHMSAYTQQKMCFHTVETAPPSHLPHQLPSLLGVPGRCKHVNDVQLVSILFSESSRLKFHYVFW